MDGSAIRRCPRQSTASISHAAIVHDVPHMQPALDPLSAGPLEPVPDAEVVGILADAIRDGRSGQMTRLTATYLAGVCAAYLAERLASSECASRACCGQAARTCRCGWRA